MKSGNHTARPGTAAQFELAGRSCFLQVNLDAVLHNIRVLHSKCSPKTEVMAVVKANAYGHGSEAVSLHLYAHGVRNFAVATSQEGRQLRQAGLQGLVQVFGNCVVNEIAVMRQFQLTPTVTTERFLRQWATQTDASQIGIPAVVIKVDSGMSRNGCQPHELPELMKLCADLGVPVHSLMTHLAQAWDDDSFTRQQLHVFLAAAKPYRDSGVKLHAANSAAILRGFATDLDIVRPGICLYGLPPDTREETVRVIEGLGLRPALSWVAHPTLVKHLPAGRHVGYDQTYVLDKDETIATFALGYGDGYNRHLSDVGILTTMQGEEQRVVGRVSMDAITVVVGPDTAPDQPFYVYADDLRSGNSVTGVARTLQTIPYEVVAILAARLPRLYVAEGRDVTNDVRTTSVVTRPGDSCNPQLDAQHADIVRAS